MRPPEVFGRELSVEEGARLKSISKRAVSVQAGAGDDPAGLRDREVGARDRARGAQRCFARAQGELEVVGFCWTAYSVP